MERKFDFNRTGKRMPYTVPDRAFDEMEAKVAEAVMPALGKPRKIRLQRWRAAIGIAAAACVAMVLVFSSADASVDPLMQIDNAYASLSEDDQDYLSDIYNEDIYINQDNSEQ